MHELNVEPYRQQLQSLASRLSGGVASLQNEAQHPTGTEGRAADGQADPGTETSEEELARTLLGVEGTILAEVDAALERIEKRTFGKCESCGHAITRPRLDALPYARRCVRCTRAADADQST